MDYEMCDMRFINLNSANAQLNNGSFLSDVKFNFANVLTNESEIQYVTCGVLNAQIPVSFYTINYTNYLLNFSVDSGPIIPLLVTRGNYNSYSLITELIAQFATFGYTFTITTSKITGIMTFVCSGHSFVFYGTSTLFPIIGFVSGTNYNSSSSSLTAIYPLNLLGIKRLKINSSALSTNTYDSYGMSISSNIASIPVNVASFGLIDYVNNSNAFPKLKAEIITYVDIQIYDENNNLINFNGINWTLTIQLNIYRKGRKEKDGFDSVPMIQILSDIRDELSPPIENNTVTPDDTPPPAENSDQPATTNDVSPDIYTTMEDDDLETLLYNGEL
jgi:hypothetical protein